MVVFGVGAVGMLVGEEVARVLGVSCVCHMMKPTHTHRQYTDSLGFFLASTAAKRAARLASILTIITGF